MELIKQGDFECVLAVVAMLSGQPLSDVRWAAADLGIRLDKGGLYASEIAALRAHYGLKAVPPGQIHGAVGSPTVLNLAGRGSIIYKTPEQVRKKVSQAHAVAYEDWAIFDPAEDRPIWWEEYSKRVGKILSVVKED